MAYDAEAWGVVAAVEQENHDLRAELDALRSEFEGVLAYAEQVNEENADLVEKNAWLNDQYNDFEQQVQSLSDELYELQLEYNALAGELHDAQRHIDSLEFSLELAEGQDREIQRLRMLNQIIIDILAQNTPQNF